MESESESMTDYYAPHNHWLKTFNSMSDYPDEEGDWINTEEFVYGWLKERMQRYPNKYARLYLNRKDFGRNGFHLKRLPTWSRLPGYEKLKENEGYFYLKRDSSEWLIEVDDVYDTYDLIMRIQDRIMKESEE